MTPFTITAFLVLYLVVGAGLVAFAMSLAYWVQGRFHVYLSTGFAIMAITAAIMLAMMWWSIFETALTYWGL